MTKSSLKTNQIPKITAMPMIAAVMVAVAFWSCFGSPAEVRYWKPPMIKVTKAARPAKGMMIRRIFLKMHSKPWRVAISGLVMLTQLVLVQLSVWANAVNLNMV